MKAAANSIQSHCSSVCSRAGVTSLLSAVVALSLAEMPVRVGHLNALGTFVEITSNLTETLSDLDQDSCWISKKESAKATGIDPETAWTIGDIAQMECGAASVTNNSVSPNSAPAPRASSSSPQLRPPSQLRVVSKIPPAIELRDFMHELSNPKLIERARGVSNEVNAALFKWDSVRVRLLTERLSTASGNQTYDTEQQLAMLLNVADVRKLVGAAPFGMEAYDRMMQTYRRIGVPGLGMGVGFVMAIHLVLSIILMSMSWFLLHQKEAEISRGFPAPATIFAVFSRSRAAKLLFYFLLSAPVVCSVILAWAILRSHDVVGVRDKVLDGCLAGATIIIGILIGRMFFFTRTRPSGSPHPRRRRLVFE